MDSDERPVEGACRGIPRMRVSSKRMQPASTETTEKKGAIYLKIHSKEHSSLYDSSRS